LVGQPCTFASVISLLVGIYFTFSKENYLPCLLFDVDMIVQGLKHFCVIGKSNIMQTRTYITGLDIKGKPNF